MSRILKLIRRRSASPGDGAGGAPVAPRESTREDRARHAARRLTAAIERSLVEGDTVEAIRLSSRGARIAPESARLSECLARLQLDHGCAEAALRVVESCRERTASLRMLRATCLILLGQYVEGHLDLHRWSRKASAPLDARILLALLEWRHGRSDEAIRVLRRNLRHLEDPRTLQALLAISAGESDDDLETWASRLRAADICSPEGTGPDAELLLRSLGRPGMPARNGPTAAEVSALAMELVTWEAAIAPLVAAQILEPDHKSMPLLRAALDAALPELATPALGYMGLSELAIAEQDLDAAASWVERGLEEHPMSVGLARLAQRIDDARRQPERPSIPRERAA